MTAVSLLDDLRNLLARHLAHVNSQTQQGTAALIEDHLNRLDAVVGNDFAAGEARVHEVLGELYAATNAPAGAVPSTPAAPAAPSEPAIVGEASPEAPVPTASTNPTSMGPSAAAIPDPTPTADPAPAENVDTATPAETNPAA